MNIRLATKMDIPQLAQMRWDMKVEIRPSRSQYDQAAFLKQYGKYLVTHLADPLIKTWVAETNGIIIAQVQLQICPQLPSPERWDRSLGIISNVYTVPSSRATGVASTLLKHVITWSTAHNMYKIILTPRQAALSLYATLGFRKARDLLELPLPHHTN